jgi:hypothetical protein
MREKNRNPPNLVEKNFLKKNEKNFFEKILDHTPATLQIFFFYFFLFFSSGFSSLSKFPFHPPSNTSWVQGPAEKFNLLKNALIRQEIL